ncbi:hypothetical protein VCC_000726 [Vibrio cholerae RC9]|nr:hypothetical protein VCD_000859 [Vibrio cholerae MJ-1236]EEO11496.1 hypothetical protein VCC_000661 [Vibrio cholerae RC9]EEO18409.1 hypothetical protein VCE_000922 [Vibrio cholerae B33]EEO21614.1 hypothetical protein VCF_001561 [Vibrio cholerae BX 330286]EEO11561.1 hypothetical protein VCC_000726 [Vibrio cholerae RC9]
MVISLLIVTSTFILCRFKFPHNKRLKRDCQRVAFPVPMSRGGYGCCD